MVPSRTDAYVNIAGAGDRSEIPGRFCQPKDQHYLLDPFGVWPTADRFTFKRT
jgi:hypothetical protein